MQRVLVAVVPACTLAVLVAAGAATAAQPDRARARDTTSVTIVEHAANDTTTDTGVPGDSAGDLLTFANDVYDASDTRKVGTDQGYCIRIVPATSYECTWTTFLAGGQLVVAGPFFDTRDSTLAITGGTGRYRGARGTMGLHALENGTKFRFAFKIAR
jgi:allene oxide cyclase